MAVSRRDRIDGASMKNSLMESESLPPETPAATTLTAATTSSQDRHADSMITVRGLAKRIGTQDVLRGVDLAVARGETLAIIGRSGGGKIGRASCRERV